MLKVRQIGLAAVAAMAVTLTGCGSSAPQETADLAAVPEYSGTLSILTKFGGEPLEVLDWEECSQVSEPVRVEVPAVDLEEHGSVASLVVVSS